MRVALISDIHANADAMSRVIEDARNVKPGIDEFWCLGDVFGRGPFPNTVWDLLVHEVKPKVWLAGNEDWGLIGRMENLEVDGYLDGSFETEVWRNLVYQRNRMIDVSEEDYFTIKTHIEKLPILVSPRPGVYLSHGNFLIDPKEDRQDICLKTFLWEDYPDILQLSWRRLLAFLQNPIPKPGIISVNGGWDVPILMAVGHTHVPGIYWLGEPFKRENPLPIENPVELSQDPRYPVLINPGSIGFPGRDRRGEYASYAILDFNEKPWTVVFRKVLFDRHKLSADMASFGYSMISGTSVKR